MGRKDCGVREVLCLGGPNDGQRVTIDDEQNEFRMRPLESTFFSTPIALARGHVYPETWYCVHKIYDGEMVFHVATLGRSSKGVISRLIEGYRPLPDTPKEEI